MLQYSPKIVTDSLVMCLDASQNKSYPTTDLPVKGGLLLWLDAADDSTFSYSSGTVVSQWRDKSGNNFHANQSTTAQQPSRNTINNSRKSVFFNAASRLDYMTISSGISLPTDTSIFIVYKPSTQSYQYAVLIDNYHGQGGNYGFVIQRVSTNSQFYYANAGDGTGFIDTSASPWTYTDNVIQLLSLNKASSTGTPYISGTAQTSRSVRAATAQSTTGLAIGYWGNGGGRFYNGDMCEILIFNRSLSSTEMKQVHTYLGQKWGISNTDRSIVDLSGNDDNGLLGNGTVANIPAYDFYNKGTLRFDGSNDYVFLSNSQLNISSAITVEAWVKYNAQGGYNARAYSVITCKGYPWTWLLEDQSGQFNFRISTSVNSDSNVNSSYSHGLNTWNHVVGTYDGVTQKIYVDGVLRNSVALTGAINTSSNDALVGCYNYGDYCLTGNVGAVRIYNKALSAVEVAQNYEAQKSKFANTIIQQGLVLNLDAGNPYSYAGAGTVWYDVSSAVNDFTIVNSPTYSVDQFTLNGSTQYFSISTGSGFFISSTNNFYADVGYAWSISVWFKFPVAPTNVRDGSNNGGNCSYCLFGNSGGIGGAETLALFVSGIGGTTAGFHPYYCIVGVRGSKTQLSPDQVNTNAWNNVVVTWNGSVGRGYFNGVDRGALNIGANGMQVSGYTIGTTAGGNQGSHTFEGSLSQVFVYNRVLSAAEVLQNYNATKGRFGL